MDSDTLGIGDDARKKLKQVTDFGGAMRDAVQSAFGGKPAETQADPGMVKDANQTFVDKAKQDQKPAGFMARAMKPKPAPAPQPSSNAARNRYGSLNRKTKY